MLLLADRWTPGIGDPSFAGWLTVAAYFGVAVLCLVGGRRELARRQKRVRAFWMCLSLVLIALGINKQLDLQSLFTQLGKDLARVQGWYGSRRIVQAAFIVSLGVLGAGGLGLILWRLRRSRRAVKVALAGCLILFCFILIRASSFHHMDRLIGWQFLGLRVNWLLELGSLALVASAAWQFRRPSDAPAGANEGSHPSTPRLSEGRR